MVATRLGNRQVRLAPWPSRSITRLEKSDAESGLYYYRARYYDPNAGRFISEDPGRFGAGIDFYAYVSNRSVDFVDAFGLSPTSRNDCFKKCYGEARVIGAGKAGTKKNSKKFSRRAPRGPCAAKLLA